MEELKVCPWCGLYPKVYKAPKARGDVEEGFVTNREVYTVECHIKSCDVQPATRQYTSRNDAVKAWNERFE